MIDKKTIERVIELKQLEEKKALDEKQAQELMSWQLRNAELAQLSLEQLQDELQKSAAPEEADFKSSNMDEILADYKKKFGEEEWYQEPKVDGNKVTLTFASKEALSDFAQEQAEKNRPFVVVDAKTQQVMAYSNGDGKLYHGNGKEFNKGDELRPCGGHIDDFKMPLSAKSTSNSTLAPMNGTLTDTSKGLSGTTMPKSGTPSDDKSESKEHDSRSGLGLGG